MLVSFRGQWIEQSHQYNMTATLRSCMFALNTSSHFPCLRLEVSQIHPLAQLRFIYQRTAAINFYVVIWYMVGPMQNCPISSAMGITLFVQRDIFGADSRFAPTQWETSLQSNAVYHWLGANLESALYIYICSQLYQNITISILCADLCWRSINVYSYFILLTEIEMEHVNVDVENLVFPATNMRLLVLVAGASGMDK